MKKNNLLIIFFFLLLGNFFACDESCDGVNLQELPLGNYVINYSEKVADTNNPIPQSYKTYALVKRGVIKVESPFRDEITAMNDLVVNMKKVPLPSSINAVNDLDGTGNHFDNIKQAIVSLDDTLAKAVVLFNQVNSLVDDSLNNTTDIYRFLNAICSSLADENAKFTCKNAQDDLKNLITKLYGKSAYLVLQTFNNNLDSKNNDLKSSLQQLKQNLPDSHADLNKINNIINDINNIQIPIFDKTSDNLLRKEVIDVKSAFDIMEEKITELLSVVANNTLTDDIKKVVDDIEVYIDSNADIQNDIKIELDTTKQTFINNALNTYASVLVSKDIDVRDNSDIENIKNIFEIAKQVLLVKGDMDAQATEGLAMSLAISIHNDPKSNVGNVYSLDISAMINDAREFGKTDSKEIQDFVVKATNQAIKELAAKNSNNIVFVIDASKLSGLPIVIDYSKLIETSRDYANVLVFGKASLLNNINGALSYVLQGLSPAESFLVAQSELRSLNASKITKLSQRTIDMAADNIARLLFLKNSIVNISMLSEATNTTFAKLANKLVISDKDLQNLVAESLSVNAAEVHRSSILKDSLVNLTQRGTAYYQQQASDTSSSNIVKNNNLLLEKEIVNIDQQVKYLRKQTYNNKQNLQTKNKFMQVVNLYADILKTVYNNLGMNKANDLMFSTDPAKSTATIRDTFAQIKKVITSGRPSNFAYTNDIKTHLDDAQVCNTNVSNIDGDNDSKNILKDNNINVVNKMLNQACSIVDSL